MVKFKIVADSSADIIELGDIPFSSAPLKIITAENEYIDDKNLNIKNMVDTLASYKGRSSTSQPSPEDWIKAFGDAEFIFCITITATLSGTYNSACIAKELYEGMYPERRVFVLNSLSTGPEMKLNLEKVKELIKSGEDFDSICEKAAEYLHTTGLLFMLESMKNLANNGRVKPIVAKAAGILGIRVVGKASDKGDLQQLDKCRGQDKALSALLSRMEEFGLKSGKVRIAHCFNPSAAEKLKNMILESHPDSNIEIYPCGALCSFYAEKGGVLIGFEKR